MRRLFLLAALLPLLGLLSAADLENGKKSLTYQDIMRLKQIQSPIISENGLWVAYTAKPDRGDSQVIVRSVADGKEFLIERGSRPLMTKNGGFVAAVKNPSAVALAKKSKTKPKPGMALMDTSAGKIKEFDKVQRFAFSDDSQWLAYLHHKEEEKKADKDEQKKEEKETETAPETPAKKEKKKLEAGSTLVLFNLVTSEEIQIPFVMHFAFDSSSRFLAFVIANPDGKDNGLYYVELSQGEWARKTIAKRDSGRYSQLTWSEKGSLLAFLVSDSGSGNQKIKDRDAELVIWDGSSRKLNTAVSSQDAGSGWYLPEKNQLRWTRDGKRIFFGFKPEEFREKGEKDEESQGEEEIDLFDVDKILDKSEVDVWHWNDPLINTHQKNIWPRIRDKTYAAVYHVDSKRSVKLADMDLPDLRASENPEFALGSSNIPYQKEITWYGRLSDIYVVNLKDGSRRKVASRLEDRSSLSPNGRYVVYYRDKHWHLFDRRGGSIRNLTKDIKVPFYNEDHDYPSKVPSYGTAGWTEGDSAVLIYDKYDIWKFPVRRGDPVNITGGIGRKQQYTFRILRTDRKQLFFSENESLLLSAYHNREKHFGFYSGNIRGGEPRALLEEKKKFIFLVKAERADALLYTRESYTEFPDLWVSGGDFKAPQKISDVNPQISDFAWGSAELVDWTSVDGIPLQGVLIKPGNYEAGKRYPVLVYYYRFFSQRLYEYNQTVINHRPCFPFYASHGYAVFLPDIRFDVGLPGYSATKCLVPGIQKLIKMGIADPNAIGLHGHSWSGYQTAFVVTQTDIFTCAVAGAPVSNMTSAYSGIRWGSGMARQFQYEKSQSRIGGSLWEKRDLYIENSPVFFADRIQTPLLIIFGDEDGAVPWYQGIELYLAMRRLGKDCIFLQYRGEPHHPQKYPNKLDWFKKMKEYFDHYLKGMPAPDWISKGILYRGK